MSRIACVALAAALCAQAQAPRTVLAGVYSEAQAARGEAIYEQKCARCHEGADVDGPSLKGAPFVERWREDTLSSLYAFIRANMPQDAPGKLDEANYRDAVAYLLRANTYPAGAGELTADALGTTLLVGKDGPKPLPANALVQAVGCLNHPGDAWTLTSAAEPLRTRNGDTIEPAEKTAAASRPLGNLAFQLRNLEDAKPITDAASLQSAKVLVKGVLNRQAAGDRINVLSYEVLGKGCQR